jgi:hypothetical protein
MQVFVCEFLVRTKSSASISNNKTDHQDKDSTSKNHSGQSQFVVKSSFFDGEFSTLHNHDICNGSVILRVRSPRQRGLYLDLSWSSQSFEQCQIHWWLLRRPIVRFEWGRRTYNMLAIEPGSWDCSDKELTPLHVREIRKQLTLVSFPAFACKS